MLGERLPRINMKERPRASRLAREVGRIRSARGSDREKRQLPGMTWRGVHPKGKVMQPGCALCVVSRFQARGKCRGTPKVIAMAHELSVKDGRVEMFSG